MPKLQMNLFVPKVAFEAAAVVTGQVIGFIVPLFLRDTETAEFY